MTLNWSTFLLEIINFLVLIWILKRFLYQPVLDVIARRRADIDAQLAQSHQLHDQAVVLKLDYENRLTDWEQERQQARDRLAEEMDAERAKQLAALQTTLAEEREKMDVAAARQQKEVLRKIEHQALQHSAEFCTRLLEQAAGAELESRLLTILLDDLANLSREQVAALTSQWGESPKEIIVSSAYPLAAAQQQQLTAALLRITDLTVPVDYTIDATLLAGLRITIGAWVLHTNVRDELKGFTEFAHAAR